MPSSSFTVSAVAGGGTKTQNVTGFVNLAFVTRITVTPSAAGDSYKLQLFQDDAFTAANLAYDSGAVTSTHSDPREDDAGVYTAHSEDNLVVCVYQDEDATQELHVKVINNDASSRNFDVAVDYWEPVVVSASWAQSVAGAFTVTGALTASSTAQFNGAVTVGAVDLTVDTATLHVDSSNDRVGVGTASPLTDLDVQRSAAAASVVARVYNTDSGATSHAAFRAASAKSGEARLEFADNAAFRASIASTASDDLSFRIGSGLTEKMNLSAAALVLASGVALTVGTPTLSSGAGSPEGVVTAPVGSLYMRTDGGAVTSFYVKESGAGNTGWAAK